MFKGKDQAARGGAVGPYGPVAVKMGGRKSTARAYNRCFCCLVLGPFLGCAGVAAQGAQGINQQLDAGPAPGAQASGLDAALTQGAQVGQRSPNQPVDARTKNLGLCHGLVGNPVNGA
jgi:hypothetical protein